jgi:hypothetical protein
MKNITLPKELLNLPHPWGHSLSQLTFSKSNCIPEEMITYWAFSAEWLAERIPTFDEFDLAKVEQFLISDEGIDSPSPQGTYDWLEQVLEANSLEEMGFLLPPQNGTVALNGS